MTARSRAGAANVIESVPLPFDGTEPTGRLSRLNHRLIARRGGLIVVAMLFLTATLAVPVEAKAKKNQEPTQLVAKIQWGSDPEQVAADLDARIVDTLIGSRRVVLLEVDGDQKKALKRLAADPRIKWVEPNSIGSAPESDGFHAWPSATRPVPATAEQRSEQAAITELNLRGAQEVATGAGVKIAVLDTGIDASHPALRGRVKRRLDLIDGDFRPDDVGNGLDDDNNGLIDEAVGHGTHVAGIIALAAPDATILAYRVLDSDGNGTVFGVAEAIRHAVDAGANIINLSFGTDKKLSSVVLRDALKYAQDSGVLVVAAAGNDGSGAKRYPAAEATIVSVGAYDPRTGRSADFASYGKWVGVAAPGVNITSTVPGGGFATWSGSSMAAPFVSAEAALLLEMDPGLSLKQLTGLIETNTEKIKGKKLGKGRINVSKALAEAAR